VALTSSVNVGHETSLTGTLKSANAKRQACFDALLLAGGFGYYGGIVEREVWIWPKS
jgi:hypothetical protein